MDDIDKPAFEVIYGTLKYQIWADGRIAGFPEGSAVINRIPQVVAEAIEEDRNSHDIPGEDN